MSHWILNNYKNILNIDFLDNTLNVGMASMQVPGRTSRAFCKYHSEWRVV